ncbi:cytochrome P450 family protein [Ktedonospora formicarum]|uniref:Cytochrome P450 n=1 Tax=Ktedonospora formicarum TaxID=2778364 RepID=A0A8J3I9J5_9CHLR|nr:cytochrome P450 [Ktedonospora formicarum]GHO49320.1 cytochrome P450 [Ktedonospora formicarum]
MGQITLLDLVAQDTKRDPFTFYERLRVEAPLIRVSGLLGRENTWLVTNYDDAIAILKDPRFFKDLQKFSNVQPESTSDMTVRNLTTWRRDMLTVDPPDHTRLRGLVSQAFTPRMIEHLRPRVQQITDELLDAVEGCGEMDLIAEFAYPLPITVISELLGIPTEDRQGFRAWTQALLAASSGVTQQDEAKRTEALQTFIDYISALLARKREHPEEDLISGMLQARDQNDALSERELVSTIFLLIVAGHETTVNLIGNGMLALLTHPEQREKLQRNPELLSSAIEELLRFTAPVSISTLRWASEDVTLHGQIIRKGELVLTSLIGANYDAVHFHHPQQLDIEREENKHIAFGKGIHFCLGAPLARMEGQVAIGTLLRRLPHLRLIDDESHLNWTPTPILRGLVSLPVAY